MGTGAGGRRLDPTEAERIGPRRLRMESLSGHQVRIVILGAGRKRGVILEPPGNGTLRVHGEQGVIETSAMVLMLGDRKGGKACAKR